MGLLGASSRGNDRLNFGAIVDTSQESGVEHGALLMAFTEAAVRRADNLAEARAQVAEAMGSGAAVDAAGTIANFQRMVRIADGMGIPVDGYILERTGELPQRLGLTAYRSAANTFAAASTAS